jgi:oligopeptide/dipeptide ABC transporter ATP-binding protein
MPSTKDRVPDGVATGPRPDVVLSVRNLTTVFETPRGAVAAVNGVSFDVRRGETLGIVGESGSGKSMTALSLMRLVREPGRVTSGQVLLEGTDLLQLPEAQMRRVRGSGIALILQDPMTSLNPVLTIGNQMIETLRSHGRVPRQEQRRRATELLQRVRIPAAADRLKAYQHQLSGGMRQRVAGAFALACEPTVLIADEPTTALDATTQLQYLDMLRQLQRASQLAVIFITHDFGIVASMCDHVAVMYAGRLVEVGDVYAIFERPAHPYTRALLNSVPTLDGEVERLESIPGQPPSLHDLPAGCAFAPRCPLATEQCWSQPPPTVAVADGHQATCWLAS